MSNMNNSYLAKDKQRDTLVFLNDFDQEYADALVKLSKRLKRKLHGVILLDSTLKRSGRNVPDKAKLFEQIVCDFSSDVDLRKTIKKIEDKLLLITCSGDYNQPYMQKVLPHAPCLLGPSESSIDWTTHKGQMRTMLKSYDESLVPEVLVVEEYSEKIINTIVDTMSFPLIIKPTGLAASMLVSKVHDKRELKDVLSRNFELVHEVYEKYRGRGTPGFIVEEFIEGQLYSTDIYVSASGQVWHLPLFRVDTAHAVGKEGFYTYHTDTDVKLTRQEVADSQIATEKAVHALGLRASVAHVELFHTSQGWKIVELGPRAGGDRQDLYYLSYGVDHAYNEFLVKIGLEPEISTKLLAHSAKEHLLPEQEGVITAIEGIEEAGQLSSVYRMRQRAEIGEDAYLSENGGKVIVAAILHNKDLANLLLDVDKVRSLVKIVTKKGVKNGK